MATYGDYDRIYSDPHWATGWRSRYDDPWARLGGGWRGEWGGPYRAGGRAYGYDYRRPPSMSPTYGRGGDREIRNWARRHGYDEGLTVPPHFADSPRRYDRAFRRRTAYGGPSGGPGYGWDYRW